MAGEPRYLWDVALGRFRYAASGRLVPTNLIRDAIDTALGMQQRRADFLMDQLVAGRIDPLDWELAMRRIVKDSHLYTAMAASGGMQQMTTGTQTVVAAKTASQYAYLKRFREEIEAGLPLDGRARARARSYAEAARQTYHDVDRVTRAASAASRGMRLMVENVLNPADHCQECKDLTALGLMEPSRMPSPGTRECLTGCKCDLLWHELPGGTAAQTPPPAPAPSAPAPAPTPTPRRAREEAPKGPPKAGGKAGKTLAFISSEGDVTIGANGMFKFAPGQGRFGADPNSPYARDAAKAFANLNAELRRRGLTGRDLIEGLAGAPKEGWSVRLDRMSWQRADNGGDRFHFEMTLHAPAFPGEPDTGIQANAAFMVRDLTFGGEPPAPVKHDTLAVTEEFRGIGKNILRSEVDLYDKLGFTEVTTHANIDVGGYAWARYGYVPEDEFAWDKLRGELQFNLEERAGLTRRGKLKPGEVPATPRAIKFILDALANDDPAAGIRAVASTPLGKQLLLGSDWNGVLDLTDRVTRAIFDAYVKGAQ